jgi:hypothetical protein
MARRMRRAKTRLAAMTDVVFIVLTLAFFAGSMLYARACRHL